MEECMRLQNELLEKEKNKKKKTEKQLFYLPKTTKKKKVCKCPKNKKSTCGGIRPKKKY
tara:strand:+ start:84 stop:260 length:177 start_codon:yes stop_codon:yes gene_type:complete